MCRFKTKMENQKIQELKANKPVKFSPNEQKIIYRVKLNDIYVELDFMPYKFQISLAKLGCLGENSIICVGPGSGKTLIAAMICKYWAQKIGEHEFHAAFVVSNRKQARKQLDAFQMAGFKVF